MYSIGCHTKPNCGKYFYSHLQCDQFFLLLQLVSQFDIMACQKTTTYYHYDNDPTLCCSPSAASPRSPTKKKKRKKASNNREYGSKPLTTVAARSPNVSMSPQPPQGEVVPDNPPSAAADTSADLQKPPAIAAISIMKGDSHPLVYSAAAQGNGSTIVPVPLAKVQQKLLVSVPAVYAPATSSPAEADIVEENKSKEGHDSKKLSEDGSISQDDVSSSEENSASNEESEEVKSSQEGATAGSDGTTEAVVVVENKVEAVSMEGVRGGDNQTLSCVVSRCVSYYVL
jgi:hypothetical protein